MARSESENRHGLVIFAKDVDKVSAFYVQTLNLSVVEAETTHRVLQRSDLELVVHSIPENIASGIAIKDPPTVRGSNPMKPVFLVADLNAVRLAAEATGGALNAAADGWEIRGTLVLDGYDPEGNVIQFKQAAV